MAGRGGIIGGETLRSGGNTLQTIIFDLSEVFIAGLVGVEKHLAPLLARPEQEILPALGGEGLRAICHGRISEEQFLQEVIAANGWAASLAILKAAIRRNLERPVPGMVSLLRELAPVYELVLLSDHAAEWVAHVRQAHPFLALFALQFFSYELGSMKYRPETFITVLERIRRTPDRCLFVDDSAGNVAVARTIGIQSIQFCDAFQLWVELNRLGILPAGPV